MKTTITVIGFLFLMIAIELLPNELAGIIGAATILVALTAIIAALVAIAKAAR